MKVIMTTTTLLLLATIVRATAGLDAEATVPVAPARLSETGLYAAGGMLIDPRNRPFSPQYPLWTDGATKRRWVRLPEGTTIDASDLSRWEFPVGTKLWKEFAFAGRKVETRMLWRVNGERWVFASYVWNDAQTDAVLAPDTGVANVAEVPVGAAGGTPRRHSVPAIADCRACHDSARTEVLGFDALNLSDDRDPNAPHAETLSPEMVTLKTLTEEGLITPARASLVTSPPRITAASPEARAAIGYLSTNCGNCHNRESSLASLGLHLKYLVTEGANQPQSECAPALVTTVGRRGHWVVPEAPEESRLINPGKPEASAIVRRMKSRRPSSQMPPLGSVVVDQQGVHVLTAWINSRKEEWSGLIERCVIDQPITGSTDH